MDEVEANVNQLEANHREVERRAERNRQILLETGQQISKLGEEAVKGAPADATAFLLREGEDGWVGPFLVSEP